MARIVGTEGPELAPIVDPDEWEIDDEELVVSPRPGAVISVRLDADDLALIRKAAIQRGMRRSEFIHDAIVEKARATLGTGR